MTNNLLFEAKTKSGIQYLINVEDGRILFIQKRKEDDPYLETYFAYPHGGANPLDLIIRNEAAMALYHFDCQKFDEFCNVISDKDKSYISSVIRMYKNHK